MNSQSVVMSTTPHLNHVFVHCFGHDGCLELSRNEDGLIEWATWYDVGYLATTGDLEEATDYLAATLEFIGKLGHFADFKLDGLCGEGLNTRGISWTCITPFKW